MPLMPVLPNKLYLLCWSVVCSGLAGIWVWRMRSKLAQTRGAPSPWAVPLLAGGALMLFVGWWNGMTFYMADEGMYLLSANTFAEGMWTIAAPPVGAGDGELRASEFHFLYMVNSGGRMYPRYPMGWPAILAGISAIVPPPFAAPLLGIGILLLTAYYARRFLPAGSDEGTMWVMVLSASFLLNCAGFTSHAACGLLLILGAIFVEQSMKTGRSIFLAAAMLTFAAMTVVRPLVGAMGMATAGLILLFRFGFWRTAAMGIAGAITAGAILAWQNVNATGAWYRSAYAEFVQVMPEAHSPAAAIVSMHLRRVADTIACSFPLLLVLLLAAYWHPETRRRSAIYTAYAIVTLLAYGMIPIDSESPFGERYLFECMILVFLAAGMAWAKVKELLGERGRWALPLTSILLSAYSLWTLVPAHHQLRRPHTALMASKESLAGDAQLVFLEYTTAFPAGNYWINPLRWQEAKTIFIPAPKPERREAVARILNRPRWRQLRYQEDRNLFEETARSQ